MRAAPLALAISCAAALAGCHGGLATADVPGTYVLNSGDPDSLFLDPGHNYRHVSAVSGARVVETGAWNVDSVDGITRLGLDNYLVRSRRFSEQQLPARGAWVLELQRTITGAIKAPVVADLGLYYVKR